MGRRKGYKQDYISYWLSKGKYGEIRVNRMKARVHERYKNWAARKERNAHRYNGSFWKNGVRRQWCEMGGTCEYPCNGDC